ncbi:TonB-dependent receptor [Lysobacter arenosi]|uniref:TonB-dependent receptor n=1 Tax=Lysobacter arenosi TaxID=2795387 RepID=A0ABX7RB87_9GAMM|nr:TonB-dependent receptor [Lysobacter arenosi]QSX75398.1 TonB-dependent receptor [Lysobacter arenosi]
MNGKALRRATLSMALGACIATMVPMLASAQTVSGAVAGNATQGDQITVTNTETGLSRTTTADAKGNYRIAQLPIGNYSLQVMRDGQAIGQAVEVTVSMGSSTNINLGGDGAVNLASVQVVGSRVVPLVDVTSTESAMTLTAADVDRLPVDRDLASVALLAPGVTKGESSFGGISFGGSSVAENSFYINGLNVTDFYNRNGFSEAPFAFYKEFQVKTGGYSVEFGRTTGGVINTVAKSGTNEFESGAELVFEPRAWQSKANDRYFNGERYLTFSQDDYSDTTLDLWASGPLIKDRLFFFALYELRDYEPTNTNDEGTNLTKNNSSNGFWGGTLDWYVTDNNILSLMAFSNKNENTGDVYTYDYDNNEIGNKTNEIYNDTGGDNWALSWSSYFTSNFSMKVMYGENHRQSFNRSLLDLECNRVQTVSSRPAPPGVQLGCSTNSTVFNREDVREQTRADFEWSLGDHLLRFGVDHEVNTSDHKQYYAGPGALFYNVNAGSPGSSIPNPPGGVIPPGYTGYVRARRNEIAGNFESTNTAFYLEDNWSITDNFLLNLGIRNESFDNKDGDGKSYIEMDEMWAPRLGFAWDINGDSTMKLFGNVGRYFLPVANVINIKQAGGLLDQRTYYAFDGWDVRSLNGVQYAVPRLGPQIGTVDVSQGDGTVGDLRSEVDRDLDSVYQDEAILGFQQMLNEKWSWGVRGIYRKLTNAIDDMEISATGQCGEDGYIGWVMANPGEKVTVWGDTDCNGNMGWVTVDTAKEGWALYDEDGNYQGQRGWVKPKRTYKALEFQLDRAWDDKWALNMSYTWSKSEGNAEGPVNSDTNFSDTGRTENFDDPWVNYGGYGPLANDRRHQLKARGTYAFNDNWQVGGTLDASSGGPITGFGTGNPFDAAKYHSYYICVAQCDSATPVYEHSARGAYGEMPWTWEVGASVTYLQSFGDSRLRVKFAVFNLFNQQKTVRVDQELQPSVGMATPTEPELNEFFGVGYGFQAPRYAQLSVTVDF